MLEDSVGAEAQDRKSHAGIFRVSDGVDASAYRCSAGMKTEDQAEVLERIETRVSAADRARIGAAAAASARQSNAVGATAAPQDSGQEVVVLGASFHGMDDELVAAVEEQDDELEQPAGHVEAEAELSGWTVVIEIRHIERAACRGDGAAGINAVLECGGMNLDYAAPTHARMATRMASDRLTCCASARFSRASSRSASMRTGTTVVGPSPRGGRPRLRRCSTE